jgi:hypothetical protein
MVTTRSSKNPKNAITEVTKEAARDAAPNARERVPTGAVLAIIMITMEAQFLIGLCFLCYLLFKFSCFLL